LFDLIGLNSHGGELEFSHLNILFAELLFLIDIEARSNFYANDNGSTRKFNNTTSILTVELEIGDTFLKKKNKHKYI
ncbi:hypothetical protein ACJX0J_015289, partial [Zea mays]